MSNYNITRMHIENLILSCFLNQNRTLELDTLEFSEYKLPFELFKASRVSKMIAKAIRNMQDKNDVVDDLTVYDYISSKTEIDTSEYYAVSNTAWVSFDTCMRYLDKLKTIDTEDTRRNILKGL